MPKSQPYIPVDQEKYDFETFFGYDLMDGDVRIHNHPLQKDQPDIHTQPRQILYRDGDYAFVHQSTIDELPPGNYFPSITPQYEFLLMQIGCFQDQQIHDDADQGPHANNNFIHFPIENYCPPLMRIATNVKHFLENKSHFKSQRIPYKRSYLLHGEPGSGKTLFIERMLNKLIRDQDAIVIHIDSSYHFTFLCLYGELAFSSFLSDRLTVFVIDSFSDFISRDTGKPFGLKPIPFDMTEEQYFSPDIHFLSGHNPLDLLKARFLQHNCLFFFSTYHIDELPQTILDSPSTLDNITEVTPKDYSSDIVDDLFTFLMGKPLAEDEKSKSWYKDARETTSIAHLKELFLYTALENVSLQTSWERMKEIRANLQQGFPKKEFEFTQWTMERIQFWQDEVWG